MGINLVQNCRNRIIAAQPHIATLPAANLQQFITDVPAPIKDCKVHFSPIQTGTGTPNPNNIRPITGNTEVNITIADYNLNINTTTTLTLPTTLYGGTINLITGEITQNYQLFSFDGTENWETAVFSTPGPSSRIMIWLDTISGHNNYDQHNNKSVYCSHFSYGGTASTTFGEYRYNPVSGSPPRAYFAIMDPNTEHFGTLANFKQFLADQATNDTPVQVLIPLTVPKYYQINPITLKTLRGINNIWSDAGNISLKYWTH